MITLLMGAVGWMLGRPGVLRPDPQAFAGPQRARTATPHIDGASTRDGAPNPNARGGHADVRGE
jgi:hypothetical protein